MKKIMIITICLIIAIGTFVYGQRRSLPAQESRFLTRPPGARLKTYPKTNKFSTNKTVLQKTTTKQKSLRERVEDLEKQVHNLTNRVTNLEEQLSPQMQEIGEIRILQNYEGLGPDIPLVIDIQARDKFIGFARDDNMEGIISLMANNKTFLVSEGTKVQLLSKYEKFDVCLYEVKIMEGQFSGKTGWASSDWLIKPKEKTLIP